MDTPSPLRLISFITALTLMTLSAGCSTTGQHQRTTASQWKHQGIFISEERITQLRDRINSKTEPNFSAWLQVKKACDEGLSKEPHAVAKWAIPGFYDGHADHENAVDGLHKDTTLAYDEALCFQISRDSKYAKESARLIDAWAMTLKEADPSLADTKLSMNEFFSPMIVAADLLENSGAWSEVQKIRFHKFISEIVLPLNTMEPKTNNHANWGVLLVLCIAAYNDDLALFEKAEARIKALMDLQIGADGTMQLEVDRSDNKNWHGGPNRGKNGLWYSNYALTAMTMSAEVLRLNGRDLFEYKTASGKSMRLAFEKTARWDRYPEEFPFYQSNHGDLMGAHAVSNFEILNQHWKNENATDLLEELRPLTSAAGMPHLTLTHGGF